MLLKKGGIGKKSDNMIKKCDFCDKSPSEVGSIYKVPFTKLGIMKVFFDKRRKSVNLCTRCRHSLNVSSAHDWQSKHKRYTYQKNGFEKKELEKPNGVRT